MKSLIVLITSSIVLGSCSTTRPISATANKVGKSRGEACAVTVLGIIPLSTDASIHGAAKNGKISNTNPV